MTPGGRKLDRTQLATVVVAFLVGASLVVAAAQITNQTYVDDGNQFAAPGGPEVVLTGQTSANLSDWYDNQIVKLNTTDGNITFRSVNGYRTTHAEIAASDITGTWTRTTNLNIHGSDRLAVNPEDKEKVTISGGFDRFEWADYALDDGNADFEYGGPDGATGKVTLYNLPADTEIEALDTATGETLASGTTGPGGEITLSMPMSSHTVELVTESPPTGPILENPAPTGSQDSEPDTLRVDVSHQDMGDRTVDVYIYHKGSLVKDTTVTSNTTVSASIPDGSIEAGPNDWSVEAQDSNGVWTNETYTYSTNSTVYIRPETDPDTLVTNTTNVKIVELGTENPTVIERTVSDGTVNISGIELSPDYIVTVDPEGYHGRNLILQSVYDQASVYVLNKTVTSVESRFVLDDTTGQFPPDSRLIISRAINQSGTIKYRTVHSDVFGAEGVTVDLEQGTRYRLTVVAPDGDTQVIGPYRADVGETVNVQPGVPQIQLGEYSEGWAATAELNNRTLEYRYSDPQNKTDSVKVWIHERGNTSNQLQANETYYNLGNFSAQATLTANESEKEWVVKFIIDRDGEKFTAAENTRNRPELVPDNLADGWKTMVGAAIVLLVAGLFSTRNVAVGGIATSIVAGLMWWLGFLGGVTSGSAIAIALMVSVLYKTMNRGGGYQ